MGLRASTLFARASLAMAVKIAIAVTASIGAVACEHRAATPVAQAPPMGPIPSLPSSAKQVTVDLLAEWTRQLEKADPRLRARARALLDVCSVVQEPPDETGGAPTLACVRESFSTPSAEHSFRVVGDRGGYADTGVDVVGSFTEPGIEERLVMLVGESNGSSGWISGFLFRHHAGSWIHEKTFLSFPATSCAVLPRNGRSSLLFCGFQVRWQGVTNIWAATFDASTPLTSDTNTSEVTERRGRLPMLQRVMSIDDDDERVAEVHNCPDLVMQNAGLLPLAPVHVASAPGGATLIVRINNTTVEDARKRNCRIGAIEAVALPTRDLTYALALRGEWLLASPAAKNTAQDRELRRLAITPPR